MDTSRDQDLSGSKQSTLGFQSTLSCSPPRNTCRNGSRCKTSPVSSAKLQVSCTRSAYLLNTLAALQQQKIYEEKENEEEK
jgi:hypothetical protein